ncbi:hypothetical protein F8388_000100 [Cannabis sativa]|uniref:Reverse transcriptase zinc-binding domain-containing protein n=1 Tax=Cannabis sativa TaxID=3483 RepID=A0A7J6FMK0_CANSA|nr:hypothetical protein F8388_000100 [Cannabis sativa]KAF4372848.1 hypothetical protein G4B88_028823 [Cannabis sativa]
MEENMELIMVNQSKGINALLSKNKGIMNINSNLSSGGHVSGNNAVAKNTSLIISDSKRRRPNDNENNISEDETISLSPIEREDCWSWKLEASGMFSVKSSYKYLTAAVETPDSSDNTRWKSYWQLKIPQKVLHFGWRALTGCLPTKTQLHSKHVVKLFITFSCNALLHTLAGIVQVLGPHTRIPWDLDTDPGPRPEPEPDPAPNPGPKTRIKPGTQDHDRRRDSRPGLGLGPRTGTRTRTLTLDLDPDSDQVPRPETRPEPGTQTRTQTQDRDPNLVRTPIPDPGLGSGPRLRPEPDPARPQTRTEPGTQDQDQDRDPGPRTQDPGLEPLPKTKTRT